MTNEILDVLRARLGPDAVLAGDQIEGRDHVDFGHENACAPLAVVRPRSTRTGS